ncbi:Predicted ATPase [Flexibacter flexilis DSM 6793]|uniref:Predicted ATPase n=1 Tax=Flexibacter flexilis DSM 6793 TaxID=927664 RepID=A0A1I1NRW5_9BACT|nr:ATP-binding protein [Flexibacter flexilis]SFD00032.1 Predicted ATPase [Flexibacter flexilis DSM 6793]
MITRIKIDGFKSLLNTELYFSPFTCIVGANAAGKSNLFDAIMFLSHLADNTLLHAAKSVRSEDQKHSNIRDIFFKSGKDYYKTIRFEVDMIIPKQSYDDLGQEANATITALTYILEIKLNADTTETEPIGIVREELKSITQTNAKRSLRLFEASKQWIDSVLEGKRSVPFISTQDNKIQLHQDGGKGRSTQFIPEKMPRTLLSTVTAESPTAFLARQEMRNWMMLQFEPTALREPNTIFEVKNAEITAAGHNMPATLYRLHNEKTEVDVYQGLTNKLKELVPDIKEITIDKDDRRDLLTLEVKYKDGLTLPAQSLSDGTLRFLGLAVLREDNQSSGLICLEEPENGINPKKIKEMLELLKEMATNTDEPIGDENPLRQVIINSHSPKVVSLVPADSLYLATTKEIYKEEFNKKVKYTAFEVLPDTWRAKANLTQFITSLSDILVYLDEIPKEEPTKMPDIPKGKKKTVRENIESQMNLFK